VGVGVGETALTVSETVSVTGEPVEGVMTAVAEYVPAASEAALTETVTLLDMLAASLPLVVSTESHEAEIEPIDHESVPPPPLVIVSVCDAGLLPAFVE
jgi:hypothetical protein